MSLILKNFKDSLALFKRDRGLLLLGLVPLIIGVVVYSFIGKLIYVDFLAYLNSSLEGQIGSEGWFEVVKVVLTALLTLLFYFLISWTFISVVGIFACPFNDLMAGRVEKLYLGQKTSEAGASLKRMLSQLLYTVFNELRKVFFVMTLTIIGILLSFVFPPIGVVFSSILIAVSFIDYSWGQHDLNVRSCFKSYKRGFWIYTLSGVFFMFWVAVPVLNLLALPFGVVYFSLLFVKKENPSLEYHS